ncbi:MAG TPA: 1-deoxy-D-xylulose-5-phosphate reductoisomerase [Allosphingosinicella sp.]|nr:1-deoxy-D-xylulose-5-phosphate reductoisomerase [Allosphingosinicella sp.]
MTRRRSVTILGATGSIGRSTLDLIERSPDSYEVVALTAHRDVSGLAEAARRVNAGRAVIAEATLLEPLRAALAGSGIEAASGDGAVLEAAGAGADWTMAAIVGTAGLSPTMAAIRGGRTVALANKEALVSAGHLMIEAATGSGAALLPVDSEHNAIYQCFDRARPEAVRRIILTASGGPFRDRSLEEMRVATPDQAIAHPNWSMGAKISVDCATLMNKGLELIEAFHLFPLPAEAFEIVIHPQSVVHSLVEYVDGSVLAQLGSPDMRIPIAYTLAWPDRMATPCERLDLVRTGSLAFSAPDLERFPALALARQALTDGGATPAVLNASNEVAVAAFLGGAIGFLDIASIAAETLQCYAPAAPGSIEEVLDVDRQARAAAELIVKKVMR